MKIVSMTLSAIDNFKSAWPCHGIPAAADLIVAAFTPCGDLVDYEICDASDDVLDEGDGASAALSALLTDAFKFETNGVYR